MRLAYSISGYKDPAQFAWLFDAIADPRDVFILHIDAQSPPAVHKAFRAVTDAHGKAHGNVHYIEPEPIVWMGRGLVQAEFRAIACAFQAAPDFDHLINLSAQDYPLTTRDDRIARLKDKPEANHVALKPLQTLPFHVRRRRFLYSFEWQNRLIKTPFPRTTPNHARIDWKGSWWRILSREFCAWLMTTAKRAQYERFLFNVQAPDELIIQNLIMASPFRQTVTGDNQHFIRWPKNSGSPQTFTRHDLDLLLGSAKLFARKFDHREDETILRLLAEKIGAAARLDQTATASHGHDRIPSTVPQDVDGPPSDRSRHLAAVSPSSRRPGDRTTHDSTTHNSAAHGQKTGSPWDPYTRNMFYGYSILRTVKQCVNHIEEDARTAIGRQLRHFEAAQTGQEPLFSKKPVEFRPYQSSPQTGIDAQLVSPADGHYMHSFFDVPPVSPDGRFLLLTRIPFIWRLPAPGDVADLCVVDLDERTIQTIHRSQGWAMQLGINAQWHPQTSGVVFCNDLIEGQGRAVRIDLDRQTSKPLDGPLYTISSDGRYLFGPSLTKINHSQDGYGVPVRSRHDLAIPHGLDPDDGIWRTNAERGTTELLISTAELAQGLEDRSLIETGQTSLFHTKAAPGGKRLLQVMRHTGLSDRPNMVRSRLLSLSVDGGDVRELVSMTQWDQGGHHPNWRCSDYITMNLAVEPGAPIEFVDIHEPSGSIERRAPGIRGSGHPTIRHGHIVTDCYHHEGFGDQTALPLRMIDLESRSESAIIHLQAGKPGMRARRIDPHPAWSPDGRFLIANCTIAGQRQVLMIDCARLFGG